MLPRASLAALLAALLALPGAAASHLSNYTTNPVEHDDQGRSSEPDFAVTGVLGPVVENRIYDPTPGDPLGAVPDSALPPVPEGHAAVLAPGCSDDDGRQASGRCGLATLRPPMCGAAGCFPPLDLRTLGVGGMSGTAAPGRFSLSKATQFRFLDALAPAHLSPPAGGVQYIEVNRKVDDATAAAPLPVGDLGGDRLPPQSGLWAWYGRWQDKNGNGVIDELGPTCTGINPETCPPPDPADEWTWVGNCLRYPAGNGLVRADICMREPSTMLAWVYPGNHHAGSWGNAGIGLVAAGVPVPADLPGRQAACAAQLLVARGVRSLTDGTAGAAGLMACPAHYDDFDASAEGRAGDPLLDDPTSAWPDLGFSDRTGDSNLATRQWVGDAGNPLGFYDEGLLTTTFVVTAVFSPPCAPCDAAALPGAAFVDVDRFPALHPLADLLLQGTLKPAARSAWTLVRDLLDPAERGRDHTLYHRTLGRDALLGPLDDALLDPGYAREPNTALDRFPAPREGYAQGPHAWLDVQERRSVPGSVVLVLLNNGSPIGLSCILCAAGPAIALPHGPMLQPPGTPPGTRSLRPGAFLFGGHVGLWHDQPQVVEESGLDPTCLVAPVGCGGLAAAVRSIAYAVPADGWIGSIVDTTGYYRMRGYDTDACDLGGGAATWPYAFCHPTRDGLLEDPQNYAPGTGEWRGACVASTFAGLPSAPPRAAPTITITPLDAAGQPGLWANPTFVEREVYQQRLDLTNLAPWTAKLEDWTGRGAITMTTTCASGSAFEFPDLLVLPLGNLGQDVQARVSAAPLLPGGSREQVTDVDTYARWGA